MQHRYDIKIEKLFLKTNFVAVCILSNAIFLGFNFGSFHFLSS